MLSDLIYTQRLTHDLPVIYPWFIRDLPPNLPVIYSMYPKFFDLPLACINIYPSISPRNVRVDLFRYPTRTEPGPNSVLNPNNFETQPEFNF